MFDCSGVFRAEAVLPALAASNCAMRSFLSIATLGTLATTGLSLDGPFALLVNGSPSNALEMSARTVSRSASSPSSTSSSFGVWVIPILSGEFVLDRRFGYRDGLIEQAAGIAAEVQHQPFQMAFAQAADGLVQFAAGIIAKAENADVGDFGLDAEAAVPGDTTENGAGRPGTENGTGRPGGGK